MRIEIEFTNDEKIGFFSVDGILHDFEENELSITGKFGCISKITYSSQGIKDIKILEI